MTAEEKFYPPYTAAQRRALHKYCQLLAQALNDAGYDMKTFLEQFHYQLQIPWTKESVKDVLWRPVQRAMLAKESTTELDTVDPSAVYEALDRNISEKTGVHVEWPSRFSQAGFPS